MSDPADTASPPPYKNSDAAPFVYFDIAPTFGVLGGAIQVELAARVISPGQPTVTVEFVSTAHLRCSAAAAYDLKAALEQALKLLDGPQAAAVAASKLN